MSSSPDSHPDAEFYRATLSALPIGVAVYRLEDPSDDLSLRLVFSNAASDAITGLDGDQERGRFIAEVAPKVAETDLPRACAEVARSGASMDLGVVRYEDERIGGLFSIRASPLPQRSVLLSFTDVSEAHAERNERERQGRRFEAVFQSSFQLTALLEPDGTVLEANRMALDLAGSDIEEVRGRELWATGLFGGARESRLRRSVARAAEGTFVRYTADLEGDGGRTLRIDFSIKPIFAEAGHVALLVVEGRDVTDLVQANERIAETGARQHAILAALEEGVVLYSREGAVLQSNPAARRLLGVSREEIERRGYRAEDWLPLRPSGQPYGPDDALPVTEAFTSGEPQRRVVMGLRQEEVKGGVRWLSVNAVPVEDEAAGLASSVVASFIDITDLRSADAVVRASEARLRAFVDNAPVVFYVLDREGRFVLSRGMARGRFEWGDVHGRSVRELARTYPAFGPVLEAFEGGRSEWTSTVDGRTFENRSVLLLDDDGALDGLIAVATDVTDRTRAEAQLSSSAAQLQRQAAELSERNAELEQFAYVASHDLQEPLRMVTSFLQLLERRYSDAIDESGREYIQYAVDGARRMQRLIQDLLAYSRVGTHGRDFEPVDLEEEVETVRRDLGPALADAGGSLRVEAGLPTVMGDAGQLRQVLQNLIGNAIKFNRPGHPPTIRVWSEPAEEEGTFAIHVEDDGIGLDPKYADRVFQVFQRLHTREEYAGTGIGLAIVKKIIERHDGTISYAPGAGGTGTRFTIELPAARTDASG